MHSEFVREQKRYTQKELCKIFSCSEEKTVLIIRKLKEFGVLKAVKAGEKQRDMSELIDEDIEVSDVEIGENEYFYVFTFVGVIVVSGIVLKCYPKYLLTTTYPEKELTQVIKVLEKYNSKEQIIRMFNDSSESSSFNLLAVLLFLMQDYYENGIYKNTNDIVESNGSGEIIWDKTINETFAMISNNRPYYVDLQTRKRISDDNDFFKRLHECVLTIASKELENAGLLNLFELMGVDLTEETLDDFGDREVILYNLEKELSAQFNTRKQLVLKTIYTYLDCGGSLYDIDCLSLFGTNSFNLVWEKVCAEIMDNQLDTRLGALALPTPLSNKHNRQEKLIDIIEKPLWEATGKTAADTLIPDIITISKVDEDWQFMIFDAKYYNAKLEFGNTPKGQPGIESVTKQYLYQMAYKDFIDEHKFSTVKNCFLMPTEKNTVVDKETVSLQMFAKLESIKVRFLPAAMAYENYLSGRKLDLSLLNL